MIIFMSDILCITNRNICRDDFLPRIIMIAQAKPCGIVLREKDLSQIEYKRLARQIMDICDKYNVPCILHSFVDAALSLNADKIHLPMSVLRGMTDDEKKQFSIIGASCHSAAEAIEAESLGCGYVTAGHIFDTDCKKGLPGRGLDFLKDVCRSVSVPVYAIGGIDKYNVQSVRAAGAKGACVMSGLMLCDSPMEFLAGF